MYKAILFDLGKVLIPFDFHRAYRAMEEVCPCPADEIRSRLGATDLMRRLESGSIEPKEFAREVSGHLGLDVDYGRFCDIWCSIFLPETLVPESVVSGLKRDYRLIIVSNTNAIHFAMLLEHYPILRHFDGYVLSHQVHAMKPAPEFYQAALAAASCAPEECLFIDDLPENVEGARRAGMEAVQFHTYEELAKDFALRGIPVVY